MNAKDFEKMAKDVTKNYSGKTISHASYSEYGMSYSLTLYFTDGTTATIMPEFDEGFKFSDPHTKTLIVGKTNDILYQGGPGGSGEGVVVTEDEEKKK